MKILLALVGIVALFALYVRLAPTKINLWHQPVSEIALDPKRGFKTSLRDVEFERLHRLILQTPETTILAGDPASQHVTYVTRSKLWRFPDYTTVEQFGSEIVIVGRLRFGSSDVGVNRARIEGWVEALK